MSKFPLLEELRANRLAKETEIKAPVIEQLNYTNRRLEQVNLNLRKIEELTGSKLGEYIIEIVGQQLSRKISEGIANATAQFRTKEIVTIPFQSTDLMYGDKRTLERKMLDQYCAQVLPKISLSIENYNPGKKVQTFKIRIPEMIYNHTMEVE